MRIARAITFKFYTGFESRDKSASFSQANYREGSVSLRADKPIAKLTTNDALQGQTRVRLVVVMGVCGSGKSSVGAALAQRLNAPFLDGDDYHTAANVTKMAKGAPLTDEDRWPWLDALGRALVDAADSSTVAVAACSALRRAYRERLKQSAGEEILFTYLEGSLELITQRMSARIDHFMPTGLIDSQFATLERPETDERAITIDIRPSVSEVAQNILHQARVLLGHQ